MNHISKHCFATTNGLPVVLPILHIGYLCSLESNVHICSTFVHILNLELFYNLCCYIPVVEEIGEHRILYHVAALKLLVKLLQTLN